MSENVIDNSNIMLVYKYKKLTVTQQSNYFIKFISYNFRLTKISTNDSKLYYYNEKQRLWSDTKIQQFECFVYNFLITHQQELKC